MSSVNSMVQKVSSIFNAIDSIVSNMKDGDRMQIKELAQAASDKANLNPQDSLVFVQYFTRNTDCGYTARGKNGGFIKGKKQEKKATSTKLPAIQNEAPENQEPKLDLSVLDSLDNLENSSEEDMDIGYND